MTYTQHSPDNELISGCIKQNRLAQKYLYQRYFGKMLGIAMRFWSSGDEANDILNRGFLKVFEGIIYRSDRSSSRRGGDYVKGLDVCIVVLARE